MNPTMEKFGAPDSVLKEFRHWVVLLRPKQVTLGSLVLIALEKATALSHVSQDAFTELHHVTNQIEQALHRAFGYDKINYLMLMMVDPDVHFHIVPRYASTRTLAGQVFHDESWPGPPDLSRTNPTDARMNAAVQEHLLASWERL